MTKELNEIRLILGDRLFNQVKYHIGLYALGCHFGAKHNRYDDKLKCQSDWENIEIYEEAQNLRRVFIEICEKENEQLKKYNLENYPYLSEQQT